MSSQVSTDTSTLEQALGHTESVREGIVQSAAELVVNNAVLKQEIPDEVQTGEVAQALEKNDALETRVLECAEELAEVNKVLEQEIDQRASLEAELASARAALAQKQSGTSRA